MFKRLCVAILGCLMAIPAFADVGFNAETTIAATNPIVPHGQQCSPREEVQKYYLNEGYVIQDNTIGTQSGLYYTMYMKNDRVVITTQAPGEELECFFGAGIASIDLGI